MCYCRLLLMLLLSLCNFGIDNNNNNNFLFVNCDCFESPTLSDLVATRPYVARVEITGVAPNMHVCRSSRLPAYFHDFMLPNTARIVEVFQRQDVRSSPSESSQSMSQIYGAPPVDKMSPSEQIGTQDASSAASYPKVNDEILLFYVSDTGYSTWINNDVKSEHQYGTGWDGMMMADHGMMMGEGAMMMAEGAMMMAEDATMMAEEGTTTTTTTTTMVAEEEEGESSAVRPQDYNIVNEVDVSGINNNDDNSGYVIVPTLISDCKTTIRRNSKQMVGMIIDDCTYNGNLPWADVGKKDKEVLRGKTSYEGPYSYPILETEINNVESVDIIKNETTVNSTSTISTNEVTLVSDEKQAEVSRGCDPKSSWADLIHCLQTYLLSLFDL